VVGVAAGWLLERVRAVIGCAVVKIAVRSGGPFHAHRTTGDCTTIFTTRPTTPATVVKIVVQPAGEALVRCSTSITRTGPALPYDRL